MAKVSQRELRNQIKAVQKERLELSKKQAKLDSELTDLSKLRAQLENVAFEQRERISRMLASVESHIATTDKIRADLANRKQSLVQTIQ